MRTFDSEGEAHAGRVVIVTGGGGGLGAQVTRRWLASGASVLVVDHGEESLVKLLASLPDSENTSTGLSVTTLAADVTTQAGAEQMILKCQEAFGKPADTLLHLVGGFAMAPVADPASGAHWERMLALNVTSAFHCYRAVLDGMRQSGRGWIVGIGSRAAQQPTANLAAYAASKAGLAALTRSLAAEVRDENIHVNLIVTTTLDTPANRQAQGEADADKWVQPDDIADATFYLCSERARAVQGATLEVYGRL